MLPDLLHQLLPYSGFWISGFTFQVASFGLRVSVFGFLSGCGFRFSGFQLGVAHVLHDLLDQLLSYSSFRASGFQLRVSGFGLRDFRVESSSQPFLFSWVMDSDLSESRALPTATHVELIRWRCGHTW